MCKPLLKRLTAIRYFSLRGPRRGKLLWIEELGAIEGKEIAIIGRSFWAIQ
jgi:hypothetical protein